MCILVLEFKADIWSASQRSSLMRSSSSCLALLICSLVALSCFSRRDGPFPHFPVPSMKHFKLDIVSELRPIKGGNEFLLGFRPRFRLSNMVVFGRFSQNLVKKMWVISDPRHLTRHPQKFTRDTRLAPFRFSRYFWPPSRPSFFLGTNTSPTLLGSQALFPLTYSVPLSFWAQTDRHFCHHL